MDTKINPHKFDLVLAVALRYTHWLSRIGVDKDGEGKTSTPLLIPLTTFPHDEFFGEVEKKWLSMMKNYNMNVLVTYEGQQRTFSLYSLLWGRMCVTAYFYYHDDPFWKNIGLREMRALNDIIPMRKINIRIGYLIALIFIGQNQMQMLKVSR